MPKKTIQDIKRKKSLSSLIPLKTVSEAEAIKTEAPLENQLEIQPKQKITEKYRLPSRTSLKIKLPRRKWIVWFGVAGAILGILYWMSVILSSVTVRVHQKSLSINFTNEQFTALKNAGGLVHFEIMSISDEVTKDLIFSEPAEISTSARGTVTLYNEYSTTSQKLAIHTRLTSESGKIYTTDSAVTIPGYTKPSGKIVPGQVKVGITASGSGDTYNGTPKYFSILGFKGTTKYTKMYARATTAITGGAKGTFYTLGAAEKGTLIAFTEGTFRATMIKKLEAQVPPEYILYPNAMNFSYNIADADRAPTPQGVAHVEGTLSAVILKKDDLSNAIIHHALPDISDSEFSEIEAQDISTFSFAFSNEKQIIAKDMQAITFTLSGNSSLLWHPDLNILKNNLAGMPKITIADIFARDPGIASATATFYPPWQKYVPNDISKIKIILN